jgi:peptidoglycan-N-acetylglucosamine deacetylase
LIRAVSHCFAHPSHEAKLRCTSCGRWVCDRCANEWGDRVFCSHWCHAISGAKRLPATTLEALRSRVAPHWSIAVVASAAALLLSVVGSHLAVLLQESTLASAHGAVPEVAPIPVSGRLAIEDGESRLDLEGPPNGRLLVFTGGSPAFEVTLDASGSGSATGLGELPSDSGVQVVQVSQPPIVIRAPVAPPATALPSPPPSATHTPSPRPTATATSSPVVPAKPSVVVTPRVLAREDRLVARAAPPVLHLVTDCGSKIAITFDGADSSAGTADLLDVLHGIDLQGTLFVTGEFIDANPSLVRHALLAGHEFGNHTYSHEHLTSYTSNRRHDLLAGVTRTWFHDQLRRTEQAFFRATGRTMAPLWRAPYGEENALLRGWAMELGYLHVRWSSLEGASLDSLDWVSDEHSALYRDPSRMVDRLLRFPRLEGGIVLMHLSSERDEPPWNELPRFLAALRSRGLQPVTVTDLLADSDTWRPWLERAAARHEAVTE